jgi:hypothetical protein
MLKAFHQVPLDLLLIPPVEIASSEVDRLGPFAQHVRSNDQDGTFHGDRGSVATKYSPVNTGDNSIKVIFDAS